MHKNLDIPRIYLGRGGGQVVTVLAFYSDNPSSNAAEAYSFSVKFVFENRENKQKEAGVGPCNKILIYLILHSRNVSSHTPRQK